jgi:hypothetical protein
MSVNAPDLWYNSLMLNNLEYRYEPSSVTSGAALAGFEPDKNYMNKSLFYNVSPTCDESIILKGGRINDSVARVNIIKDLGNLETYIYGLNIEPDPSKPNYGCLFYDPLAQIQDPSTEPLPPNYFEPEGQGGNWGMFVSGADEYNRNLRNEGRSSLFSIISPMPVVYDTDINAEPEYKFYIPEFNLQGSFLKDFIESSSEPLPYSGFPQNGEPENGAFTLRPDNYPLNEPATNGYFLNKYFTYNANNGGWPFTSVYSRILKKDPTTPGNANGNWKVNIINEIGRVKSLFTSVSSSVSQQVTSNINIANQYDGSLTGYYLMPPVAFQANNGTNIYIHDSNTNITVRNTNPYLNLLYLKVEIDPVSAPTWWELANAPQGIPLYQGEPENSPIPFQRNNLLYPSNQPFGPATMIVPEGGGVWCFSEYIPDSTPYRLLMFFGQSESLPSENNTTNIVPGPEQSWPVSMGVFELDLASSVGQTNWDAAFTGNPNLNISLLEEPEGNNYSFGLNYLDINGAYLQTPLVGDSYTGEKLPNNKSIYPCGQNVQLYYEPGTTTYSGSKAPIDWTKSFDCGLGKPLYGLNNSVGGYGYGNLNEDKKQTQDLNSINIISGDPDPL